MRAVLEFADANAHKERVTVKLDNPAAAASRD